MSEKVYQLDSNQIGVVKFKEPWILIHFEIAKELEPIQFFYSSLEEALKKIGIIFEDKVINCLTSKNEGYKKLYELKKYLLSTWMNPGIENVKELLVKDYDYLEFLDKSPEELINYNHTFLALTIILICLKFNKNHFHYEGIHISAKFVDKMLAVDFWSKIQKETTK
ncbi:hypothetical protein [Spiroplasma cantharicola]|uniref:Uncharacterized protein n=1 Tax=Spiroplasma cantharicola TaxID=362837 RepID=A0A0M5KE52_9MOLU|nr:hypothetical protein [Spiroplasma cantharicola]ALD66243.1 hypothetical protein SCANT_v1c03330 [Spiroplasma cantharicola]